MFKCYKRWELDFDSELKKYMIENYNFLGERIHYSENYTSGTYTTAMPVKSYKNCTYVNGYPHFTCDTDVLFSEIYNFIKHKKMYDNDIIIRYGDTHPHKPLPKLAQLRSVAINETLSKMILTSGKVESIYMLGDISIKALESIYESEKAHDIKRRILKGEELNESEEALLSHMNESASEGIKRLLTGLGYTNPNVLCESTIYKEREIFANVMKLNCDAAINEEGEIKYLLQEMMFVFWALRGNRKLISIIGENQYDHVLKTNALMNNNNLDLESAYVTYGVCFDAESRDVEVWSKSIHEYITKIKSRVGKVISINILLNLIYSCQNTSTQVFFDKLSKYDKVIDMYFEILKCMEICNKNKNEEITIESNDLICEMGLVYFQLHYSIKVCEPCLFFRYLYGLAKKYNRNVEKYKGISALFLSFLEEAKGIMGLN